jgi:hypothetical protein
VVAGLILLLGQWVPYLHLLLYGFAASFLAPLAAVCLGYLNALSSTAAGTDHSQPEARIPIRPGRSAPPCSSRRHVAAADKGTDRLVCVPR